MLRLSARIVCRAQRRMSTATVGYISPKELAEKISNGALATGEIVIMDVRHHKDYEKGHIKGANNLPFENWSDCAFVERAVQMYTGKTSTIVFHCQDSKKYGPSCAQTLYDRIKEAIAAMGDKDAPLPNVAVLSHGLAGFEEAVGADSAMIKRK